jgi:sorbitol-specific phosphotransferase system component IIBC
LVTVIEVQGGWATNLAIDEDGVTVFVSTTERKTVEVDENGNNITIQAQIEIYSLVDQTQVKPLGSVACLGAASNGLVLDQGILTVADLTKGLGTATVGPAVPLWLTE